MAKLFLPVFIAFSYLAVDNAFQIQPRIINGFKASVGQFPYFAHLLVNLTNQPNSSTGLVAVHGCGATLISDQWLLTAAHCLRSGGSLTAFLGTTTKDQENLDPGHLVITVDRDNFHIHPKYSEFENDIGLFEKCILTK